MDKRNMLLLLSIVSVFGLAIMAWWQLKEDKDAKIKNNPLLQAGKPDQLKGTHVDETQIENANMVSEGSQFGVQYFNETTQDMLEEIEERIRE